MFSMRDLELWGQIEIPEWDLGKFWALFLLIKAKKAKATDLNAFSTYLMFQIHLKVRSESWKRTLNKHKIEPSEAAATVLARVVRKLPKVKLKHPCPKVLIAFIVTIIERELISVQRSSTRKTTLPTQQSPEDYEHADRSFDSPALAGLKAAIDAAEDSICGIHRWRHKAYRYMAKSILSGRFTPPLDEMPKLLADKIGADGHIHLAYHLSRVVRQYAADFAVQTG